MDEFFQAGKFDSEAQKVATAGGISLGKIIAYENVGSLGIRGAHLSAVLKIAISFVHEPQYVGPTVADRSFWIIEDDLPQFASKRSLARTGSYRPLS